MLVGTSPDATPHGHEAAPVESTRGIRCPRPGKYVVRVNVSGVQEHVGTFSSREEAVAARDKRMSRLVTPIGKGGDAKHELLVAAPLAAREPRRVKGVYERRIASGIVYDVLAYQNGCYCWGGRYRTRVAAEEARGRLEVDSRRTVAAAAGICCDRERGISIRYNKGGSSSSATPRPVYVARAYDKRSVHLGTFRCLDNARAAIAAHDAALKA